MVKYISIWFIAQLKGAEIHGENFRSIPKTVFEILCFLGQTGPQNQDFGKSSLNTKCAFLMNAQLKMPFYFISLECRIVKGTKIDITPKTIFGYILGYRATSIKF